MPMLGRRNLAHEQEHLHQHSKYLKMIEDCESYKLALLLQQICKESEFDYAVQWQTLIQVQRFLQYAHATRLLVRSESARLDSY
ncbi:Uncharacterised protein [Acinetobacter baumannii]|nr:Uncharacterised protein [Acinetobacter baumannii]SSS48939.1 Uncharacterised protein [Acinetobacter baumannii]